MLSQETLSKLRAMTKQAKINSAKNTDEEALETQALYPDWSVLSEGYNLEIGERVNYKAVLYKVIQTHQKQEAWNPVDAPSLFAKVLISNANDITEWEQPDSTNGYMIGDKVIHNGITYESLVDNNVWEPGATGTETLWKEVTE
mgnify:CR=1 FL=1